MAEETRTTKDRSPNFPYIPLSTALQRAQEFYDKERRGTAPFIVAVKHWNMSSKSSGALQTVSALKQYGLMEDEGSGQGRKVRLTELALRIILDTRPDSLEKPAFMRQAALSPPVAAEIYSRWPDELPSTPNLNHYLVVERRFNPDTARKVVKIIIQNQELTEDLSIGNENNISEGFDDSSVPDRLPPMNTPAPRATAGAEQPYRSAFMPPMPKATSQGLEIANFPVSMNCTIRLLATGPWRRQNIETLVAMLTLALNSGVFDEGAAESGLES